MRWYGHDDPVRLEYVRQVPGVDGIVSAGHDIPAGETWPRHRVRALREGYVELDGSLGAHPDEAQRLPETVRSLGRSIHFLHARNVRTVRSRSLHESEHPFGGLRDAVYGS